MTDNYGRIARMYDRLMEPVNRPLQRLVVALVQPGAGSKVLDIGCGTGLLLEALLAETDGSAEVHGIDLSPAMLEVAHDRLGSTTDLKAGDATEMPYGNDTFDVVTCSLMLHELDMDVARAILAEADRVAKPNATVAITDYHTGSLRLKGRLWRAFSYGAEFFAGTAHFSSWRRHMRAGGVPALLPGDWTVRRQKVVAGGNLAIWLCETAPSS